MNEHKTLEGKAKLIQYTNLIKVEENNQPSWDHLNKFYTKSQIPPLIGFFSKQFVLYSAIQNGYYFISIIAILVSVISASYYLKIVKVIADESNLNLLQENNQEVLTNYIFEDRNNSVYLSNVHSYLISVLTLVILLFILKPSLILNSTQLLSLSLFNW